VPIVSGTTQTRVLGLVHTRSVVFSFFFLGSECEFYSIHDIHVVQICVKGAIIGGLVMDEGLTSAVYTELFCGHTTPRRFSAC
jgi:hypothetical protein